MAAHTGVHIQSWSGIGDSSDIDEVIESVTSEAHDFLHLYDTTGLTVSFQTQLVPVNKHGQKLCFTITILISGTLA